MLTINKKAAKLLLIIMSFVCLFFVLHFLTLKESNIIKNTKKYEIESVDLNYPNQNVFLKDGTKIKLNEIFVSETDDMYLLRVEKELKDVFGIATSKYEWILYIPVSTSTIA